MKQLFFYHPYEFKVFALDASLFGGGKTAHYRCPVRGCSLVFHLEAGHDSADLAITAFIDECQKRILNNQKQIENSAANIVGWIKRLNEVNQKFPIIVPIEECLVVDNTTSK